MDAMAVGGQASTTSRIENYLGFPAGISGAELTERAGVQAARFGARVIVPAAVTALTSAGDHFRIELDGHDRVRARALIVASGARYRIRLPAGTYSVQASDTGEPRWSRTKPKYAGPAPSVSLAAS